jgi:hypothetical protein
MIIYVSESQSQNMRILGRSLPDRFSLKIQVGRQDGCRHKVLFHAQFNLQGLIDANFQWNFYTFIRPS